MPKFRCKPCYYVHEGIEPPGVCPKCGASRDQFERIPDNLSMLLDRAKMTNGLLIDVSSGLSTLENISEKGMEDNLDPSCLYLFTRIKEFSVIMKKMISAEIQSHITKNKWG